jgi:DNA-directed RNA polymerase subunit L
MNKLVSRIKLIAVGWDDTMALRILKNQYNRTVFRLQQEDHSDEVERKGLIQKAVSLPNTFEHNQYNLSVARLANAVIRVKSEPRQALLDKLRFLRKQIDNYQ